MRFVAIVAGVLWLAPHALAQAPSLPPACLDFASQPEAQAFYESQGGPASDPHGLDPNRDGRACENETAPTTAPFVTMTATPSVTGTATPTSGALPTGSSRGPWGWIGLGLAAGGLGVAGYSIWRRRRGRGGGETPNDGPPLLDDIGW